MKTSLDKKQQQAGPCLLRDANKLIICVPENPISESSVLMFVEHNLIKNIKIFTLAFTLTVVLIQLSRFISPLAVIHSSYIFLAWMPLCVMLSIVFIFGWRGVVPVLCGMFCTNLWNFHLSFCKPLSCLAARLSLCCVPVQYYAGSWERVGVMA